MIMLRKQQRNRDMRKVYVPLAAMLAMLLPLSVVAEENPISGEVMLTPTLADVNGSKAKFHEYSDAEGDGLYGSVRARKESGSFFFQLQADDILYDTQNYHMDGGVYGKYKFDLFYKEIPHNLTFDARTPLTGVGGGTVTYTGAGGTLNAEAPAVSTWNTFDYKIDRQKTGAGIRLDMLKPYYFDVSFSQEDREGIKPTATSWNAVAGGGSRRIIELPEPVDYVTDMLKAEVGYGLNPFFGAISYTYSQFDNAHNNLFYEHPNTAGTMEALSLPPDNDYYKLAFKGKAVLPMSSALSVNIGHSVAESSVDLRSQYLSDVGAVTPITLTDTVFDGKVKTTNYDIVLTSSPLSYANGKLYYKNYDKKNKSDQITVNDGGDIFQNHLFDYDKETIGAEVSFKLPADFSLTPSYKHVKVERHRGDLPESKDNIFGLAARWNGLDYMTVNAKYERQERSADWQQLTAVIPGDQANADIIEPFIRRFDAAPMERDTIDLSLDINPRDNLNLGLGYQHRNTNYKTDFIGLRDEETDTFDISADYTLDKVTLAGYFSYEVTEYYQFHRRFSVFTSASPLDTEPTDGHFNWDLNEEINSYDYGLSVEAKIVPDTLRVRAQFDHVNSNGNADFTLYSPNSFPTNYGNNDLLDIPNWDDYKKDSFQIKAIYDITKGLVSTFGYAYEKYKYNDAALDYYDYKINSTDFLSGAYKDQSYEANVFFATMKYSF